MMMTIVFGGSFNPPTLAHKKIVDQLRSIYPDALILLLPVGDDYQKPELIAFKHRFEMLNIMFKHDKHVNILDIESKKQYKGTLDTLKILSKTYDDIHFVIGSDHLDQLPTWINYKELLATYPFIVMNRNLGISIQKAEEMFKDLKHHFDYIDFEQDISSSMIRNNIHQYQSFLTKEVFEYIIENQLYKEPTHV